MKTRVYTGENGFEWVRMGLYGCVGVWGAWGRGGHKNNACRDKSGRAGLDLGPMTGEISPNIMFDKSIERDTEGSAWVHMGSHGCGGVYLHAGTGKRGNETQIGGQGKYCAGVSTDNTTSTQQVVGEDDEVADGDERGVSERRAAPPEGAQDRYVRPRRVEREREQRQRGGSLQE